MRFRKLRIAWSVGWGLLAVLLIVLWVRSYWRSDVAYLPDNRMPQLAPTMFWMTEVTSSRGQVCWARGLLIYGNLAWTWTIPPIEAKMDFKDGSGRPLPYVLGFKYKEWSAKTIRRPSEYIFVVPYYFPFFLASSLSLAPWVRYVPCRFSLRTLLIATTVLAVVLGTAVYFSTRPPTAPRFDQGFGR
jgi:hypothetical protein